MDRIFLYKQGKLLAKLSKYLVEISQTYEILVVCLSLKVAFFAKTIKNTPILIETGNAVMMKGKGWAVMGKGKR